MFGRIKPSSNSTNTDSSAWSQVYLRTTSARTGNAGATRCTTGTCCARRVTPGGSIASDPRSSASTPCAWITSSPFIAEDLGLITPEVGALRDRFELPGMRVLEFAFADPNSRDYQPHRFPKRSVVYTGTHDNDTVVGWLSGYERARDENEARFLRAERERALSYAGSDGREAHWDMIRVALMSTADTAIFPLQDLLGQGTEARMNVPGTASGNWQYRALPNEIDLAVAERMARLCETYERIPADIRRTG